MMEQNSKTYAEMGCTAYGPKQVSRQTESIKDFYGDEGGCGDIASPFSCEDASVGCCENSSDDSDLRPSQKYTTSQPNYKKLNKYELQGRGYGTSSPGRRMPQEDEMMAEAKRWMTKYSQLRNETDRQLEYFIEYTEKVISHLNKEFQEFKESVSNKINELEFKLRNNN